MDMVTAMAIAGRLSYQPGQGKDGAEGLAALPDSFLAERTAAAAGGHGQRQVFQRNVRSSLCPSGTGWLRHQAGKLCQRRQWRNTR